MSTVTVTGIYQGGNTVFALPDGFSPDNIWLLVNGQVWTGDSLFVTADAVTVPNLDLSGELVQLSDQSQNATTADPSISTTLQQISSKLDAALADNASSSTVTPATRAIANQEIARRTVARINDRPQQQGMHRDTGRLLTGVEHLKQSIRDILLTPTGSRVMRRDYGSDLLHLIGQPYNQDTVLQVYSTVAEALRRWEPRFTLKRIQAHNPDSHNQADEAIQGSLSLQLDGDYHGEAVSIGVAL